MLTYNNKTIKKKSNKYYTRYYENGKQIYISAKTQTKCLQLLKEKLKIKNNISNENNYKIITFQNWYETWLKTYKSKMKDTTFTVYKTLYKKIPSKIINNEISNISGIELMEIINSQTSRMSQKLYEFLKDIFNKAEQQKKIKENPLKFFEKPQHEKLQGKALNEKQQKEFIKLIKNHTYKECYLLCLFQGLRRSEVLAITGNDINLKEMKLTINKSINTKNEFDKTKNKQSVRIMPIFKNSIQILEKYKDYENKRLFSISPDGLTNAFIKFIKTTNFKIRLHDLRHTFITNCKNANIPEHVLQFWIGHRIGSKVTSSVYTHINNEDIKNNIEILNTFNNKIN